MWRWCCRVKTQTGAPLVPSAQASAAAAMHAPAHRKWTALSLGTPPSASVWIPRPARRGAVDVSRSARPTVFAAATRPRPWRAGLATTHRCSRAHFRNDELSCYLLTSTSSLACAQRAPRKTSKTKIRQSLCCHSGPSCARPATAGGLADEPVVPGQGVVWLALWRESSEQEPGDHGKEVS